MRKKLNVLFVEPPSARRVGGVETALAGLAQALRVGGLDVKRQDAPQKADLVWADVIHFHGLWEYSHHRARKLGRSLGRRMVVSPHGMLEDWAFRHRGWKKRPYFHLVERPSLQQADIILATSEMEAGPLLRWFTPEKIRVLPLGGHPPPIFRAHQEARTKLNLQTDEYVVLFLSRCHEKKGLHLLIEALPIVAAKRRSPIHLIVVGDGESHYVDPLRHATASWHDNLRSTWVGAVWGDEKWDYLSAADLLCLPSYSENFGLAVLEALFAGTPVLTTHATPWSSLRGTLPVALVQPTAPELADALRTCMDTPPSNDVQRAATREQAQAIFNWSTLAPRYIELYSKLAASV